MERTMKERVLSVFKAKKINVNKASKLLGIPQRTLNRQVNENGKVGMELVYSLLSTFTDISPSWLVLGQGEMLQDVTSIFRIESDQKVLMLSYRFKDGGNVDRSCIIHNAI